MNTTDLLAVLENTTDAILVHDGSTPLYFNRNFLAILEFESASEYEKHTQVNGILASIHPDDLDRVTASHNQRVQGISRSNRHYSSKIITSKGNVRRVDIKTSSIEWNGAHAVMTSLQDSAEVLNSKDSYDNIQRLFEHVLSTVPAMITLTSVDDGVYQAVSNMFESTLGYKKEDIIGTSSYGLNIWAFDHERNALVEQVKSTGSAENFMATVLSVNGEEIPSAIWAKIITGSSKDLLLLIGFDRRKEVQNLTEIESLNEELELLSTTDSLTGLRNRRYLTSESKRLLSLAGRYDHPTSVVICDIDKFKVINDTYGHDLGDEVIVRFSRILLSCLRDGDILARWGGEEFVFVLHNSDAKQAIKISERMRIEAQNEVIRFNDIDITFTVSFGAIELTNDVEEVEEGIKLADIALYKAKESGRNRVSLYEEQPL